MTAADRPSPSAPSSNTAAQPFSLPLLVWLVPQLAALFLSARRVPFSPRLEQPFELYAPQVMLAVQLAVSTLLLPFLFRTRAAAIAVVLTAAPFLYFAAYLAGVPLSSTAWAAGYLVMYLVGLSLALRAPGISARHLQLILTTLLLAGPLLVYLGAEFGGGDGRFVEVVRSLSPITAIFRLFSGGLHALSFALPVLLVPGAYGWGWVVRVACAR